MMTKTRFWHLAVALGGVVGGVLTEVLTNPGNQWAHAAWAPLALTVMSLVKSEFAQATADAARAEALRQAVEDAKKKP